ncbi:hypothetical protein K504DRAFT_476152 [Pleomassaria siparia CBS 279.74]|uniref:WSC domain-containing protein n=1 Tax=Pleomassaria siparia CBS 279.74 TaxID=1314801 RepID=A0A6G1KC58_9PLEO|nr:hypothetical protein K504DRAFT_476152 [Pleomassaria siparia CBS 279.74]
MKSFFLLPVIFLARQAISTSSPLYQHDPDTVKDCVEWYNNDEGDSCDHVRNINCEPWYEWASYCIVTETRLNATKPTTTSSSKVSSSTTSVATLGPSPTAWTSLGCYVEEPDMPILEQNMNSNGDSALIIPKCKDSCYRGDFGFAGVQKGNQCWCGSYVGGNWASDQTSCNSTCTGDKNTFCGGNGFLNIFKPRQNQAPASTTASDQTPASTTVIDQTPASTTTSGPSAVANTSTCAIRPAGYSRVTVGHSRNYDPRTARRITLIAQVV